MLVSREALYRAACNAALKGSSEKYNNKKLKILTTSPGLCFHFGDAF